jgi:CDP-diacylglycerol--serine O-phosphatidyltransferase
MRITRSIIPNLFTLANLFSGFTAIIHASDGHFQQAAFFILIAGIFDALDGVMARLTKSASELGVELDSLCDAVSFGVAPSFMMYKAVLYQWGDSGVLIASLPALAGVYRLARFNVQLSGFEDKLYFRGMPIPAGALTLVSYLIFFHDSGIIPQAYKIQCLVIALLMVSGAMISTIKYENLPRPSISLLRNRPVYSVIVLIATIGILYSKGKFLFPVMAFYLIFGALRSLVHLLADRNNEDADTLEDPDESPFDL